MELNIHHPQFLTATIMGWKPLLQPEKYKIIVAQKLQQLVSDNKIILYAYCIMNNHLHIIWQVKKENNPTEIKKSFLESTAKSFKQDLIIYHPKILASFSSRQKDRGYHFWKRRSLGIDLFTDLVFSQKLQYIHENPVKAGLCKYPEEYPFSSAAFYLDGVDDWNMITKYGS